jgi:hypothetical protein
MQIITIILGVALLGCVFLLFRRSGEGATAVASDSPRSLGSDDAAAKAQLAEARKDLAKVRQDLQKKDNELKQARDGSKSNKQKQAERLKSLESDKSTLQTRVKTLEKKLSGLGSAEDAREEMLVLERRVLELEDELRRGVRQPAPAAVAVGGATLAMPAIDMQDDADDVEHAVAPDAETVPVDEHRAAVRKARAQTKEQVKELKDSFFTQLKQERSATKDELASMRQRLRRALNDMERERRRSDNTDRAYVILKAQLEGALDRLSQFDPHLRRPDTIDPAQHLRELEALDAERRAAAAVPAETESTPVESTAEETSDDSPSEVEADSAPALVEAEAVADGTSDDVSSDDPAPADDAPVEEVAAAAGPEASADAEAVPTTESPVSLSGVDDDGWMDDEVEAKLTGGFKTV